jgi:hypothetical protein
MDDMMGIGRAPQAAPVAGGKEWGGLSRGSTGASAADDIWFAAATASRRRLPPPMPPVPCQPMLPKLPAAPAA